MKKYISVFWMILMSFCLISCGNNGVKMPKVRGTKITLTESQLSSKMDRLSFDANKLIVYEKNVGTAEIKSDEEYYKVKFTNELYFDDSNGDIWYDGESIIKLDEGQYTAKLSAFESSKTVYFDVKVKNKIKSSSDSFNLYPKIYDGKYQLKKSDYYPDTIYSIAKSELNMAYLEFDDVFYFGKYAKYACEGLAKYNYSGLNFYEKGNKFTIHLKGDLKTYNKQRVEIQDYIREDIIGINWEDDDLVEIVNLKFNLIFVFENNNLVQQGIEMSYKIKYDRNEFIDYWVRASCKVGDYKTPKIKYNKYKEIKDIDEIIN